MPRARDRRKKKKANANKAAAPVLNGVVSYKESGNRAFLNKNYMKAAEAFTKAIEAKEPDTHVLYSNRSACYAALENYDQALIDANICVKTEPKWAKGYFRKGHALEKLLRYQEAFKEYKDGLAISPENKTLEHATKSMKELLEELKLSEEANESQNPDNDRFAFMVKWLKEGGAKFPKLYLKYYDEDYRGVHSLCKVPQSEIVLYVPFDYIMTSEVAKESDIGKKIIQSGYEVRSSHSYLAAYLMQEKHNPNSFWKPYMDILPDKYMNMPIFFTEHYKKHLKGSFSLEMAANRIESLRMEFEGICRAVPDFTQYHHLEFVWARLAVITRIFGLKIRGRKTDGLVPYADMLNHKPDKETEWKFDDKMNGFTMTTISGIKRGEQVFDSYGNKHQGRYFVNYGFTVDGNYEDNEAVMLAELPRTDPLFRMKLGYLNGRPRRDFQVPALHKHEKSKEFWSFWRIVHAEGSEMMLMQESTGYELKEIQPLSVTNEIKVLRNMKAAAIAALKGFEHDLKTDHKLLKINRFEDMNHRNCILMRCGEKEVLHWYIALADKAIPMLKMQWKDMKRLATKCYQNPSRFNQYVTEVVVPLVKSNK